MKTVGNPMTPDQIKKNLAETLGVEMKPVTDESGDPPMPGKSNTPTQTIIQPPPVAQNGVLHEDAPNPKGPARFAAHRTKFDGVLEFEDDTILPFSIIKMNGSLRAKWLTFQGARLSAKDGEEIRITDFENYYETLLSMCMVYGAGCVNTENKPITGQLIDLNYIQTLPGDTIFELFMTAQKHNKLGQFTDDPKKGNE